MKVVRLGDYVTFLSGFPFKSSFFNQDGKGSPVVRIRDVKRGYTDTFYSGEYDSRYLVFRGDYLIGMDGEFNLSQWKAESAILNQRVCKIDQLSAELDRGYLSKILPRKLKDIENETPYVTVKHLSVKKLNEAEIPLPPLAEQKRIAVILDAADELRAKRREAIAQLDAFLQSTFIEMFGDPVSNPFGWDRLAFGEIIASGPQNGIYKPSKLYGSGTKILRIDSFYNGQEVVLDSLKRVEVSEQEISSYSLSESDIVINRVNSRSHLGKCALIPAMEEPILFESNMMRLHLDNKQVLPRFMVRFLQTQYVKNQILSACKDAVNQSSINQTDVKNFQVLVPPLELQDSFSTIVESVEQQKAKMRTHLAELDALFASLQHRAFNGEL